jgi:transglutaminase-like putative cysteine protease
MITRDSTAPIGVVLNIATFLITLLVFLTVCVHIGPAYVALFLLLFLCAIYCESQQRFLPRIVLTIVSLGAIGLYVYRARLADLAPQTVETLLLLLAIKLLEQKRFRDYMQIYLISVFLLAGSALLGISLIFLSYVVILTFLFNAAMVLVSYHREDSKMALAVRTVEKIVWKASLIPLAAIPLGALIFVITPRSPYPLLNFLNHGGRSHTGFSDQVRLGRVSDIQEDESVIFRAAMEKVQEDSLYWRGIVLDYFDGATWKSVHKRIVPAGSPRFTQKSLPIRHEVYIEPYGNTYLFALDRPVLLQLRSVREYGDGTFSSDEIITSKIRYRAISAVRTAWPDEPTEAAHYLQLPQNISEPIRRLARTLKSDTGDEDTLGSTLRFLKGKDFSYSLTNLPLTEMPLDDFLFRQKFGNCEYFASAFATLARINNIPARLVAGYHGGIYNNLGRYYLVAQKQAHVWVEAYLPGRGWVRYDPTPPSEKWPGQRPQVDLLVKARLYLDMVNYYWIAFVVNYDVQKQFALLMTARTAIGEGGDKIKDVPVKTYLLLFLCAGCALFAITAIRKTSRRSNAEKLSLLLLRRLDKQGYNKRPSEGLEEFVKRIEDSDLRDKAQQIVRIFEETYYKDRAFSRNEVRDLQRRIGELEHLRNNV